MRINLLKSFSGFAIALIVLCIVPSGVFAAENSPEFTPAWNITEENFTDVQADILDSISVQIAELQNFYTNVSEASNASDLQEVLSSHRPANEYMGPGRINNGPYEMNRGPCGKPELFCLDQVENVTEENFTDVQTEMVNSLENMTERLEIKQTNLKQAGEDNRAEELGERIADLQNLSTGISEASTAEELQNVVFIYMQTQAVESLEKRIEFLETKVNDSENMTDENMSEELSSKIEELNALIEEINGAESLADLKGIIFSSEEICSMGPGMDDRRNPMHHGGCGECNCPCGSGRMQDNSTDNIIDNSNNGNSDISTE